MSPLIDLHTRTLLATQPSASASTSNMPRRVVLVLCIVFGILLACLIVAMSIFLARRHKRRKRDTATLNMQREASFIAGTPSVADIIAPPRPSRRPSARTTRIVLPSPELGSVFHLDMVPNMARRASSMCYPAGRRTPGSRPRSGSAPMLQSPSPHYESLFSGTSTVVATPELGKYDTPLRVLNPSPHVSTSTIGTQVQKPAPIYYAGFNSSKERLVSSAASADSLFSGSTTTPPLSPSGTWSHSGTNRVESPAEIIAASGVPPSPHIAVECYEMPTNLVDPELTPRAKHPLSSPPPPERWEPPLGTTGSPVTLSRFPFRFSADGPSPPSLPSITYDPPVLGHQVYGLGFNQSRSRQSLSGQSTPSLKLKIHHSASDEIIAIAFAPQTINLRAVSDAVRGRLGKYHSILYLDISIMPPAKAATIPTRKRNRKRKRRAASSSSSSSDSSSSSEDESPQVTTIPVSSAGATARVIAQQDDSDSDSDSDSSASETSSTVRSTSPQPTAATESLPKSKRRDSHSPSPPPTNLPSFLPPPGTDNACQREEELKARFRRFWMASVADGFRADLEELHKEPNLTESRLSLLIDSLASGADVFMSAPAGNSGRGLESISGINEMEVVLDGTT
ncbi:unnamed protein product [Rhizoctonia solani]|uniref:Ribosome assembly protein 3 n=1 Tax=Rhizoctonia solani TaxID=456999 RepID=A0A8H3D270_9AGAM|nr:unnamed protein product [Rhizoctonia solani]